MKMTTQNDNVTPFYDDEVLNYHDIGLQTIISNCEERKGQRINVFIPYFVSTFNIFLERKFLAEKRL